MSDLEGQYFRRILELEAERDRLRAQNEELVKACKAILTNNVLVLFPEDEKLVRQALKSAEPK